MRRKGWIVSILLAGALSLVGCGEKEPMETLTAEYLQAGDVQMEALYVREDGTVQAAYIEEFGQDHYDVTELQNFMEEMVAGYNSEHGENAVVLEQVTEHEDQVYAILTYLDAATYVDFNDDEPLSKEAYVPQLEVLTMSETTERYGTESFAQMKSNKSMVTAQEVLNEKKHKVIAVTGPMRVETSGDIQYYTNGRVINDRALEVSEGQTAVIIYKR